MIQRIRAKLETDRGVAVRQIDDKHEEIAIANDDEPDAAAIDIAALACQSEERRIDDEFLLAVRF